MVGETESYRLMLIQRQDRKYPQERQGMVSESLLGNDCINQGRGLELVVPGKAHILNESQF